VSSGTSITRLDHFAWVVEPANLDSYADQLSRLLEVNLLRHPGSQALGPESRILISFDAGLELVAPQGRGTPTVERFTDTLEQRGERPLVCVIRVPSIDEAAARIERAGFSVGANLLDPDAANRRATLPLWTGNVRDMVEYPVNVEFPGVILVVTALEYAPEPPSYVDRVGRLDRIGWLVKPENAEGYRALLEALFDIRFERDSGAPAGITSYVAWDAGLEILTPSSDTDGAHLAAQLDARGEAIYSAAFAVDDLAAAVARAKALGLMPDEAVTHRDGASEAMLTEFVGLKLVASEPCGARRGLAVG
jgi:predicted enzyme related to lactoylglutathione lyase